MQNTHYVPCAIFSWKREKKKEVKKAENSLWSNERKKKEKRKKERRKYDRKRKQKIGEKDRERKNICVKYVK